MRILLGLAECAWLVVCIYGFCAWAGPEPTVCILYSLAVCQQGWLVAAACRHLVAMEAGPLLPLLSHTYRQPIAPFRRPHAGPDQLVVHDALRPDQPIVSPWPSLPRVAGRTLGLISALVVHELNMLVDAMVSFGSVAVCRL